jgi:hypothetical protein
MPDGFTTSLVRLVLTVSYPFLTPHYSAEVASLHCQEWL